jgi:uncharacterized membrane protein
MEGGTMHLFDVVAILCAGLMVGNELAVSLFINPAIWEQDDQAMASRLAGSLGKYMPFWYAASLIFIGVEAYLRRGQPGDVLLLIAAGVWVATIVFTLATLVPINNRLAADGPGSTRRDWRTDHTRWDTLHRWRIALLFGATACLVGGILD